MATRKQTTKQIKQLISAGDVRGAYAKFEELPILDQILISVSPGVGDALAAYEVGEFGTRASEAAKRGEFGTAGFYGGLSALAGVSLIPAARAVRGLVRGADQLPLGVVAKTDPKLPTGGSGLSPDQQTAFAKKYDNFFNADIDYPMTRGPVSVETAIEKRALGQSVDTYQIYKDIYQRLSRNTTGSRFPLVDFKEGSYQGILGTRTDAGSPRLRRFEMGRDYENIDSDLIDEYFKPNAKIAGGGLISPTRKKLRNYKNKSGTPMRTANNINEMLDNLMRGDEKVFRELQLLNAVDGSKKPTEKLRKFLATKSEAIKNNPQGKLSTAELDEFLEREMYDAIRIEEFGSANISGRAIAGDTIPRGDSLGPENANVYMIRGLDDTAFTGRQDKHFGKYAGKYGNKDSDRSYSPLTYIKENYNRIDNKVGDGTIKLPSDVDIVGQKAMQQKILAEKFGDNYNDIYAFDGVKEVNANYQADLISDEAADWLASKNVAVRGNDQIVPVVQRTQSDYAAQLKDIAASRVVAGAEAGIYEASKQGGKFKKGYEQYESPFHVPDVKKVDKNFVNNITKFNEISAEANENLGKLRGNDLLFTDFILKDGVTGKTINKIVKTDKPVAEKITELNDLIQPKNVNIATPKPFLSTAEKSFLKANQKLQKTILEGSLGKLKGAASQLNKYLKDDKSKNFLNVFFDTDILTKEGFIDVADLPASRMKLVDVDLQNLSEGTKRILQNKDFYQKIGRDSFDDNFLGKFSISPFRFRDAADVLAPKNKKTEAKTLFNKLLIPGKLEEISEEALAKVSKSKLTREDYTGSVYLHYNNEIDRGLKALEESGSAAAEEQINTKLKQAARKANNSTDPKLQRAGERMFGFLPRASELVYDAEKYKAGDQYNLDLYAPPNPFIKPDPYAGFLNTKQMVLPTRHQINNAARNTDSDFMVFNIDQAVSEGGGSVVRRLYGDQVKEIEKIVKELDIDPDDVIYKDNFQKYARRGEPPLPAQVILKLGEIRDAFEAGKGISSFKKGGLVEAKNSFFKDFSAEIMGL